MQGKMKNGFLVHPAQLHDDMPKKDKLNYVSR